MRVSAGLAVRALLIAALRTFLAVLFGAGTMTLSLYSLHVVLCTPDFWPPDTGAYGWHVLVLLAIGAVFVAWGRRGPLEYAVGLPVRVRRPSEPTEASMKPRAIR